MARVRIRPDAESVCVKDFCGYTHPGHFPVSFWADYYPEYGITRFGGDWRELPDMPSKRQPSDAKIKAWLKRHGDPLYCKARKS